MNHSSPLPSKPISLDQLVALNDEIAALARAGIPLESGLIALGEDFPGRLGGLAASLGKRMEAGENLAQIVSQADDIFPKYYQAVVEAGLRSGRISVALEGVSTLTRRTAEIRKTLGAALIYPLVVLFTSYLFLVFTLIFVSPVMLETFEGLSISSGYILESLTWLGKNVSSWAPFPPLLFVFGLGYWWFRSRRAVSFHSRKGYLAGAPTIGRLQYIGRLSIFSETLALMVEQNVPLHEAIVLAADASGDRQLQQGGKKLALRIQQGSNLADASDIPEEFPPMLGWLILTSGQQKRFAQSLRSAADSYRGQAQQMFDWMAGTAPMLLTLLIGGSAVAFNAAVLFAPWLTILHALASPFQK